MLSKIDTQIRNIIDEARLLLQKNGSDVSDSDIGKELQRIFAYEIPKQVEDFKPSESPLLKFTDSALVNGNKKTNDFLELLKPVMSYLPWKYNYEEREDKPELGARIGWAELIGPEAPYKTEEFCLGFTLIAPDTVYPEHNHPATELYHVLSGNAFWTLDGNRKKRTPGELILHPSMHSHLMETKEETLLALYTWTGSDVVTLSEYID